MFEDSLLAERWNFSEAEKSLLKSALKKHINVPRTSSVGRLFDAVASILGICQVATYQEEAPAALEGYADRANGTRAYTMPVRQDDCGAYLLDWQPLMTQIVGDVIQDEDLAAIAHGFHVALARGIAEIAKIAQLENAVLTGGVFQNALLSSLAEKFLQDAGMKVYTHSFVPAGDGGLAVGQALYGLLSFKGEKSCV